MPLDPKLEKKIDTVYRGTRQMPFMALLGMFVPIVLVLGGPIGLLYWFWRRGLLEAVDSGKLHLETVPPPVPSRGRVPFLSPSAKLDFIRSHKHSLLIPLYMLGTVVVVVGAFLGYLVITDPRP